MGVERRSVPPGRTVRSTGWRASTPTSSNGGPPTRPPSWRSRSLSVLVLYLLLRRAGLAPAVPGVPRRGARPGVQHRGVVRDQHELAVLRRGVDDGPPGPDEWTRRPELRLRGRRHRVAVALVRGFVRRESETIGNFWADLVRSTVRILLPIAFVGAVVLISQGVVQNLHGSQEITTVQGATQSIPGGPVASQEVIKELGTNGGGFYNANSAHPFENPNPFTNLFEIFLLLVDPVRPDRDVRQDGGQPQAGLRPRRRDGACCGSVRRCSRGSSSPSRTRRCKRPRRRIGRRRQHGGQGGPVRHPGQRRVRRRHHRHVDRRGERVARLVDAVRRRRRPREHHARRRSIPAAWASGLYGILVLAVVAVFIAGLMVGRTPEYLGKKIEPREMKLVSLYILLVPAIVLLLDRRRRSCWTRPSRRSSTRGPTACPRCSMPSPPAPTTTAARSAASSANTTFFNTALGFAMLFGRFALDRARAGRRRVAGTEAACAGDPPARSPRRRRCSWGC